MTEPSVDMDRFLATVQSRLAGFGYACCIGNATGKRSQVQGGAARSANADQPAMPFTFTTQHGLASAAKVLTAAAALHFLDPIQPGSKPLNSHGYNLDTAMYLALPSDWNVHASFRAITFRDLLGHTSGLPAEGAQDDPGQDFASLRTFLTQTNPPPLLPVAPVPPSTSKTPHYSNFGFALFRLILPFLEGGTPPPPTPEQTRADWFAAAYRNIVAGHVFDPVRVTGPDTSLPHDGNYEYEYPYPGGKGWDPATWAQSHPGLTFALWAGSGCWWSSIDEIAPVLESLSLSGTRPRGILSTTQWRHMQGLDAPAGYGNLPLGLDSVTPISDRTGTQKYRFTWKNGQGTYTTSAVAFFGPQTPVPASDGPYYAALFVNSPIQSGPVQGNWCWCSRCQSLFNNDPGAGTSVCPASGSSGPPTPHTAGGSYVLEETLHPASNGVWKWCTKCQGLCLVAPQGGPPPHGGCCPKDGALHDCPDAGFYLPRVQPVDPLEGQSGWRLCTSCGSLAYAGNSAGTCAGPEWHPGTFAHPGHVFDPTTDYSLLQGIAAVQTVLQEAFLDSAV